MSIFKADIENRLRDYLLQGSADKYGRSKKDIEENKKKEKAIKEETKRKVAKKKKEQYEQIFFKQYPNEIAAIKMEHWKIEVDISKDPEFIASKPLMDQKLKDNEADCAEKIENQVKNKYIKPVTVESLFGATKIVEQPIDYIENCKILDPNYAENKESIWVTITTLGEDKFHELKKQALELAEKIKLAQQKIIKMAMVNFDIQFDTEQNTAMIAELPLMIEDKIEEIKNILDTLLGKYLDKYMNPQSFDFDLNIIVAKLEGIIDPLLASIAPLESVVGKIPVIGSLMDLFTILSSSGGSGKLTKEEIKEIIGNFLPEIPGELIEKIKDIFEDVKAVVQQIPMLLINIIFEMIGVIIGLFLQIAGILGIPGIPFPLSLLPQCIQLMPLAKIVVMQLPTLVYASIKGKIKSLLAEAMALSIPKPCIDMDMMKSLIPETPKIEKEKPSCTSKPKKQNKDYNDIIKEKYEELVAADYDFDKTDLLRILKSYKEIYDGSNSTVNKYTMDMFEGESGSKWNIFQGVESEEQTVKLKGSPSKITRIQGTPEHFKGELDKIFSDIKTEDSKYWMGKTSTVIYDKIKDVASVVGSKYFRYEDAIKEKEKNPQVVIPDTISANNAISNK